MQTSDPLRTPTYTPVPEAGLLLLDLGAERQHQQRVRLQPRLLQPEHRRDLVVAGRSRGGRTRRRRAAAGGRQPAVGPELDAHRAAGQHGRHLGRGDRPAPDPAAPDRPDRRLPDRRPGDQPGAQLAVAGAAGDRGPGRGLPAAQLQRRPVRDQHPDRRQCGAGLGLGQQRQHVQPGTAGIAGARRCARPGRRADQAGARRRGGGPDAVTGTGDLAPGAGTGADRGVRPAGGQLRTSRTAIRRGGPAGGPSRRVLSGAAERARRIELGPGPDGVRRPVRVPRPEHGRGTPARPGRRQHQRRQLRVDEREAAPGVHQLGGPDQRVTAGRPERRR